MKVLGAESFLSLDRREGEEDSGLGLPNEVRSAYVEM